jgi:hypothetical protein
VANRHICYLFFYSLSIFLTAWFPVVSNAQVQAFCAEATSIGCDGECGSSKLYDDCKICDGGNKAKGCDNVCFSGKANDQCGVCDGGNRAKGCDGVCFSKKVVDDCGTCGGGNRKKGCDGVCNSKKKVDNCGVCGGKNAAKGCDGVCFSGKKDDGCGCGIECKKCTWVTQWASFGAYESGNISLTDGYNWTKSKITKEQDVPSCFTKRWVNSCSADEVGTPAKNAAIYGICQFNTNGGSGMNGMAKAAAKNLADFIGAPMNAGIERNEKGLLGVDTFNFEWRMDENCRYVPNDSNWPICGYTGVSWSPISLVWDREHNIDQNMTVVDFRLASDSTKNFSLWKASEKAPLLVYDPSHSGVVASAAQLFGNVAFGGVTTEPSLQPVGAGAEWKSGYEALSLLDKDDNGRVEGSELEPLSLWFDENRDAVVGRGELRSLSAESVSALFYQNPTKRDGGKDLELAIGFERIVNGKTEIGKSVDWYAEAFASEQEAGDALLAMRSGDGTKNKFAGNRIGDEWLKEPGAFVPNKPLDHTTDVGGFWVWWQDGEENGQNHPGGFALHQSNDGTVRGFSVVEAILGKNDLGHRAAVRAYPALGSTSSKDGKRILTFTVHDEFGTPVGTNTAELSADGLSLTGKTEQKVEFTKDGKPQSASVGYTWRATKFKNG